MAKKPNKPKSRQAKRTASPGPLTPHPRPAEKPTSEKLAVLAARSAGVVKSKSTKGKKAPSRRERRRKEAAVDRAGAVLEMLEKKKEVSARKGGVVKGRSADWDNLNEEIGVEVEKAVQEGAAILK